MKPKPVVGEVVSQAHKFNFLILNLFVLFSIAAKTIEVGADQKHILDLTGGAGKIRSKRADGNEGEESDEFNPFLETTVAADGSLKKISSKIKYEEFILPKGYNKLQIPSVGYYFALQGKDETTFTSSEFDIFDDYAHKIIVTLRIRNINDVDERNEEIVFSADLILQWKDHVIWREAQNKFNTSDGDEVQSKIVEGLVKTLDSNLLAKIWKPDIYIENLVKVMHPEVMSPPVTVRLNEVTGDVVYIARIRIRIECEMDFHYYPADTQTCEIELRSNSYAKDELNLEWARPFGAFLEDCGAPNFDFQIEEVVDGEHEEGYIGNQTRNFSGLGFNLVARRKLSFHMVQTFLPSTFFIIITWLCFLVPSRMVEARIGISMTTLLTLTAMFASVRENSPTVSYVRAIDIWMVACVFFVFLTLLEFTLLLWLRNMKEEIDAEEKEAEDESKKLIDGNGDPMTKMNEHEGGGGVSVDFKPNSSAKNQRRQSELLRRKQRAETQHNVSEFIEKYAFLIFSIIFILFCSIFWAWLLIGSEYFVWDVDENINCAKKGHHK